MSEFNRKKENFKKALARLEEAVEKYNKYPDDLKRDGVIKRFEFCAELTWKTIRMYLLEEGSREAKSPKAILREAYSFSIIDDEDVWIKLLDDRNLTSHVYDEEIAEEIFSRICTDYLPVFKKLYAFFSEN